MTTYKKIRLLTSRENLKKMEFQLENATRKDLEKER